MSQTGEPPAATAADGRGWLYRLISPLLEALARPLLGVSPDALTLAALPFALGAAGCFAGSARLPGLLLVGTLLLGISALLDGLDGKVARMSNRTSLRGDFLDHVIDRIADAAWMIGLGASAGAEPLLGFWAALATLLASYLGTQAQALGLSRLYGGLFGRLQRMLSLLLLVPVDYLLVAAGRHQFWLPLGAGRVAVSFMDLVLLLFTATSLVTFVQRARCIWRLLDGK